MLRDTAREDCATKDFLSLPKKVLVTLIRVICSFFSTARRTNQEAPPLLSGFLACRYGRRRGLRNSLRSDSPRPFSSVFLATSPPDKGGIGGSCLYSNPLALWVLPLYRCVAQGERDMHHSVLVIEGISPSPLPCPVALRGISVSLSETFKTPPLCFAQQNIGEVSARTEGLKTPSYQSVYTGHLTPSPYGHSPYTAVRHLVMLRGTAGERVGFTSSFYLLFSFLFFPCVP